MSHNNITVVCAGNKKFIVPMKVMLKSMLVNTKSHIDVFILSTGWEKEEKEDMINTFLKDDVCINFIRVPNYKYLENLKTDNYITIESYFRLFIPELLPDNIMEAIYLDSDIIVEGDIKELWEIEMKDNALMAVPEMFSAGHLVSAPWALHTYNELCIPATNKYFNAGVLKINVSRWRKKDISKKIIDYLIKYKEKVLWHDQDGLNAVLWNDWKELPYEWNVATGLFFEHEYIKIDLSEELAKKLMVDPKIIHYTTEKGKPWLDTCCHPLKQRFYYYKGLINRI